MGEVIKEKMQKTLNWTFKRNNELTMKQMILKEIKQQKQHTTLHAVIGLIVTFLALIIFG